MKKILSLFLIITMLVISVNAAYLPIEVKGFSDIENSNNKEAIETLYDLGLIEGYGNGLFYPNRFISRAEACTIMVRAIVDNDNIYPYNYPVFKDVHYYAWYRSYVDTAYRVNIMHGYGNYQFGPEDDITYAQFATLILNMLGYNVPMLPGNWPTNSEYFAERLGLYENTDKHEPNDYITRENAVQMFYNALTCSVVEWNDEGKLIVTDNDLIDILAIQTSKEYEGLIIYVYEGFEGGNIINRFLTHFIMITENGELIEVYGPTELVVHAGDYTWVKLSYNNDLLDIELYCSHYDVETPDLDEGEDIYPMPKYWVRSDEITANTIGAYYHISPQCPALIEIQSYYPWFGEIPESWIPCTECHSQGE